MRQFRQQRTLAGLLLPAGLFLTLFFVVPLLVVLLQSLRADGTVSLQRYVEVLSDAQLRRVYLRTLRLGLIVTPLAALLSYPAAYYIARRSQRRRSLLMSLVILPLMTSPVARTLRLVGDSGPFRLGQPDAARPGDHCGAATACCTPSVRSYWDCCSCFYR